MKNVTTEELRSLQTWARNMNNYTEESLNAQEVLTALLDSRARIARLVAVWPPGVEEALASEFDEQEWKAANS